MKKLFKAIAILTSFSILTRALGFLFRIFLSRIIGAEGLGVYQIAFSVFMVLETFVSSGLPLIVSKMTSVFNVNKDKKSEASLVTTALLIGIFTAIGLCFIVLVFKNLFSLLFTDQRCLNILLTLLPALVFSSVYATLRGNLWGHRKYFFVSLSEFIEQLFRVIICVILLAVFYSSFDGAVLASVSLLISCILSAIFVSVIYFKTGGRLGKPKGQFKTLLKTSMPITMVRVVSSLLMPIISIIIPLKLISLGYSNTQALEIFGVAMGMTFPLLYIPSTIISSLSMTLIPDLSCAVSKQNYSEVKTRVNFSIKFAIFIAFLFIPIFFAIGEPIGMFFYNNIDSGIYLSYSCWLIVPICISGVTVSCLNALNLEIRGFINYIIGSFFLIGSILFLTNYVGVLSLVWGMGLCLCVASILNICMLNKKFQNNFFNIGYLLKIILCSLPAVFAARWTYGVFSHFLPLFFSIGVSALVGEIFFLCFALIFNVINLSFLKTRKIAKNKQKNLCGFRIINR